MFCSYIRPRYQVSVYRTIGPQVGSSHFGLEGQDGFGYYCVSSWSLFIFCFSLYMS